MEIRHEAFDLRPSAFIISEKVVGRQELPIFPRLRGKQCFVPAYALKVTVIIVPQEARGLISLTRKNWLLGRNLLDLLSLDRFFSIATGFEICWQGGKLVDR
jgi:hypothetical protein